MEHSLANVDQKTVSDFGDEWDCFDQSELEQTEVETLFQKYFSIFPWKKLPAQSIGFDMGCGSGRWAYLVAQNAKVGQLYCVDPAEKALNVAKNKLRSAKNVTFVHSSANSFNVKNESMDFGYSLGVLHHVPDTFSAIKSCVTKLKPNAPFLIYLYYALDNKPFIFRFLFQISNMIRLLISKMPFQFKKIVCFLIALFIYFPLSRSAKFFESWGANIENWPLSFYRNSSFYVLKTDALDRFGTKLEKRFTKQEIFLMLQEAGLKDIEFSQEAPYWCAVGCKA